MCIDAGKMHAMVTQIKSLPSLSTSLYMCAGEEYMILGTDEEPDNMVSILCVCLYIYVFKTYTISGIDENPWHHDEHLHVYRCWQDLHNVGNRRGSWHHGPGSQ